MSGSGNISSCRDLAMSIQAELKTVNEVSESCCVYRVPKLLLDVKQAAYTPVSLSIGPFHHKNKRLLSRETHKLKYVQQWMERNGDLTASYLEIIREKEARIRESYAEPIPELSGDEFTRMVLVDSIFIIQLFSSGTLVKPLGPYELKHDLKLAENQLPFFILKDLYSAAFKPHTTPSFTEIACAWLDIRVPAAVDPRTKEADCCHLLDLVRSHYLPPFPIDEDHGQEDTEDGYFLFPTATRLYEAGVKFRATHDDNKSLLDIHYDEGKGVLTIPVLKVGDMTDSLLRNLVAFEQIYYYPNNTHLTSYLYFLDCLINTGEDVQLLVKAGIIDHMLGSDKAVADLINSLSIYVTFTPQLYCYRRIAQQLKRRHQEKWNRYVATLRHTYFRHPWAVMSFIYAIILLLFTFIQVVTGILAVPGLI